MSYQRQHLQFTVQYIVEKFRYDVSPEKLNTLTTSSKKHWEQELFAALAPLAKRNFSEFILSPGNKDLAAFFLLLAKNHVLFPQNTTYLLERSGKTYERNNEHNKCIYDRQKIRAKVAARRLGELQEQLRDLHIDQDDFSASESSDEEMSAYTPQFASSSPVLVLAERPRSRRTVRAKM